VAARQRAAGVLDPGRRGARANFVESYQSQWRLAELERRPAVEVLRPERQWEGADAPLTPSIRSTAYGQVNQLRDPAIFEDGDSIYLLYAVAGESGIGIAEITQLTD